MTDEDLDLNDLHEGGAVAVENHHESHTAAVESVLNEVEPGNCVNAVIQSEDVYRPDGIWRFIELEIYERTAFHALEMDSITPDIHLMEGAIENGQSSPEVVSENGRDIGFKIARPDNRVHKSGPVRTAFKEIYKTLNKFGSPPYEIISLVQEDVPLEIRYYLAQRDSDTAQDLIEAGDYLVGHQR